MILDLKQVNEYDVLDKKQSEADPYDPVMNDANFGTAAQTLKPLDQLQAGAVRLG